MSGRPCFCKSWEHPPVRFALVGLATTAEFQRCLATIQELFRRYPTRFPEPIIRPMLEFGWLDYLTKAQRLQGGKLWSLERSFIILANNQLIGTEEDLETFLSQWFHINIKKDFQCLAQNAVVDIYKKCLQLERKLVFFTLTVNRKVLGTMVFMLYCDIVPKVCRNFLKKCNKKRKGYRGTRIHRIVKNSWIQCADFSLALRSMSSENYIVPHNKRGLLSMCNNGKHKDNKTQFFITLNPTPWMDYRYVAFGQLLQGESVLKELENLPTIKEFPNDLIVIGNCGEITMEETLLEENIPIVEQYIKLRGSRISLDASNVNDPPSVILEEHYRNLKYCYADDAYSHFPLDNKTSVPVSIATVTPAVSSPAESEASNTDWETITVDDFFYQQLSQLQDSTTSDLHLPPKKSQSSVKIEKSKSEILAGEGPVEKEVAASPNEPSSDDDKKVPPNSLESEEHPEESESQSAESENTSQAELLEELAPDADSGGSD